MLMMHRQVGPCPSIIFVCMACMEKVDEIYVLMLKNLTLVFNMQVFTMHLKLKTCLFGQGKRCSCVSWNYNASFLLFICWILKVFFFKCRAVAKYLKDNSLESESDESGHIRLNKILERRSRKQCARMFFETLVIY